MHPRLLALFSKAPAPCGRLALTDAGQRYSPARLFKAVYCTNLLRNGEFLERTNSTRAAGGGGRSVAWVSRRRAVERDAAAASSCRFFSEAAGIAGGRCS